MRPSRSFGTKSASAIWLLPTATRSSSLSVFFFALSAGLCWLVAYKDIRVSSLLTLMLEALSVTCILVLAGIVLFKHGFTVDTAETSLKGVSLHGMEYAVMACIFSLVGFEAATTLGGEARNPLKNVPKAVIASLIITGLFMTVMAYVEVAGTRHYGTPFGSIAAPLNTLAQIYGVSAFKIPISLGAMVSFFSLSLTCLNSGSRIIYPMARHGIFSGHLGRAHATNRTPHIAITVFIAVIFLIPTILEIFTNPLTSFGDVGTMAAYGFLLAYFLSTVAAPVYLKKIGELRARNVVIAVPAFACLMVPTIGSVYPLPPNPADLFPVYFLDWIAVGGTWLFIVNRRQPDTLTSIEADLERTHRVGEDAIDVEEILRETVSV